MKTPLTYELRKPQSQQPEKTYPAIFLMHGMGSNEQDIITLVNGLEVDAYIFGIRGSLEHPPGFAYFTIEGFGKPQRAIFDETIQQLEAFVDEALTTYPINPEKVFLGGFSQGAILSMALGLTMGNKVKGVMAFSGYIPEFVKEDYAVQTDSNLEVFISHGEADPIFPLYWGEANRDFFSELGVAVEFHAYPDSHTISANNYRDFRMWLDKQLATN
ncbi:alpha/beta hydrolase [Oceanobacillus sp. CAU 1775]